MLSALLFAHLLAQIPQGGVTGPAGGGGGGPTIVCQGHGATGSGTTTTTGSLNCSGATRIDIGIAYSGSACAISDSSTNSYTLAKAQNSGGGVSAAVYFKYSPTVTGSMTFTCAGSSTFPMINVIGWSGTATSGSAPTSTNLGGNGGTSGTSVAIGPVTPTVNNVECVTELMTGAAEGSTPAIGSPYTAETGSLHGSNNVGGFIAYHINAAMGTDSESWTWTNSIVNAVATACLP